MLRLDKKDHSNKFIYGVWLLMAFQAGYVNIGGLFTSGVFVSHVTGTSSRIGKGFAEFSFMDILTFCTILFAFVGGAAFASYFISKEKLEGKKPRYMEVSTIKALFFGLVFVLSSINFSSILNVSQEHINITIIFLLSFCCGVQNSTCSLSTGGFLKPTHMTGLSTDIGIHLANLSAKEDVNSKYDFKEEKNKIYIRFALLGAFIFGGVIATMIFEHNGHYGFLFPFMSSLTFLIITGVQESEWFNNHGIALRSAKASLFVTVLITIFFGVNAYTNI
jgi:uncharacterized membrane protein YoaK (UPF0700 family)